MEDKTCAVTVLLPVYLQSCGDKAEEYLSKSLRSLADQTFKDFTVLIIGDGMQPMAREIIRKIQFDDNRFVYIEKPHSGLTKTLNWGLKHISSPYIARQDVDDWSEPRRLELQYNLIKSDPTLGIVGGAYKLWRDGNLVTTAGHVSTRKRPLEKMAGALGAEMYRVTALRDVGGWNEDYKYAQDFEISVRIRQAGWETENVPEYIYNYVSHPGAISTTHLDEQLECANRVRQGLFRT